MKIYVKDKYKFYFVLEKPLIKKEDLSVPNQGLTKEEQLLYFLQYKLPKVFHKGRKHLLFFNYGDIDCTTSIGYEINKSESLLYSYLYEYFYKYNDRELKYNLNCLDKNYNRSAFDWVFIFDFLLLYQEFEEIIDRENLREILVDVLRHVRAVNPHILHDWPHTPICRPEVIFSKVEQDLLLIDCKEFEPDKELWQKEVNEYEDDIRVQDVLLPAEITNKEMEKLKAKWNL